MRIMLGLGGSAVAIPKSGAWRMKAKNAMVVFMVSGFECWHGDLKCFQEG
jgi:hypothetical protein